MLIVSAFHFPNLGFQVVLEFGQVFEQRVDERVVDRGGIVTKIPRDIGAFERNHVENISQAAPPRPPGR